MATTSPSPDANATTSPFPPAPSTSGSPPPDGSAPSPPPPAASTPPPIAQPPPSPPPQSPPPPQQAPPPKASSPPPSQQAPPPKASPSQPPPETTTPPPAPPQALPPPVPNPSPSPPPAVALPPPVAFPPPYAGTQPNPNPSQPSPILSPPLPPVLSPSPPGSGNRPTNPQPRSGDTPSPARPEKSPPSSSTHSPPSRVGGGGTNAAESSSSSSVNFPLVIGVTAGLTLFMVLLGLVAWLICGKKKKKDKIRLGGTNYYTDPPRMGSLAHKGGGDYYGPPPTWGAPPSMDHVVKIPPPPGWHHGGAPPPPILPPVTGSSSEMSSGFSGAATPASPSYALGFNKSTFSYDELATATGGFSQGNLLGQGGFGYVHKGVLPNGKEVAVKSLKDGSGQGEREFQAEVEIISRVHHRHLVSLVGYCIADGQRMLVYEFVPNNTLEYHLHGKNMPTMNFPTRLKIALGAARGLAYLHEDCHPKIIHRDIKAANILLDFKFEAMVADFGLAKLSSDNYTHVSTRIMGTFGYLAPEYASSGKLTDKSDVFSFGVMLLELVTGRRPVDTSNRTMEDCLVEWARPLLTRALANGEFEELVDPRLGNNYDPCEMARLVACAAASVRHSAKRRPKMSQIVRALEGDSSLDDLNDGVRPGQSTMFGNGTNASSEYDVDSYNAQMKKFQRIALASEEFGSSEYGATSEYGLDASTSSSEAGNSREVKTNANQRCAG